MVKCASGSLCQPILGSLCKCNCNWLPKLLVKARKRKAAEERVREEEAEAEAEETAGKLAGNAWVWFLLCCLSSLVLACFLWFAPHAPNERLNDWSTDPVMQIVASSPVKLLLIAPANRPSVSLSPVSLGRLWRRPWRERDEEGVGGAMRVECSSWSIWGRHLLGWRISWATFELADSYTQRNGARNWEPKIIISAFSKRIRLSFI